MVFFLHRSWIPLLVVVAFGAMQWISKREMNVQFQSNFRAGLDAKSATDAISNRATVRNMTQTLVIWALGAYALYVQLR